MSKNICKFVTSKDRGQITASNFIFESRVPHSGQHITQQTHVLYLVSGGEGFLRTGGQCFHLGQGTVFLSFSDIPFCVVNTGQLEYFYIHFQGSRADELFQRFGITPGYCVFEGYEGLLPLWQDSLVRANDENIDLLSESLLLYTFSKLKKSQKAGSAPVSFVLTYMEAHFTENSLSLSKVAREAGYNEKYLSFVFKKQFGMGFSEYLRLLRIKYAVTLIESGVTSVKNVAYLSGFSDPPYFSRVFTEVVGVSPRQYCKGDSRFRRL